MPESNLHQHIIVVDDEKLIADTLCLILKSVGYSAEPAYDAEQALSIAAVRRPDLLISDVVMPPGMDGYQLAIRIQKDYPGCGVLLFSGQAVTSQIAELAEKNG